MQEIESKVTIINCCDGSCGWLWMGNAALRDGHAWFNRCYVQSRRYCIILMFGSTIIGGDCGRLSDVPLSRVSGA